MSKASEYADFCTRVRQAPGFSSRASCRTHNFESEEWFANVMSDGCLSLRGVLPASKAIALADWIYDTYGESGDEALREKRLP